jgi:hypothetical protein
LIHTSESLFMQNMIPYSIGSNSYLIM